MPAELATREARSRRVRFDLLGTQTESGDFGQGFALVVIAVACVLWGTSAQDLGPTEGALGMAAGERGLAPFGQVAGTWASDLLPGRVVPSQLWTWAFCENGIPTPAAVHLPSALAAILAGLILTRRTWKVLGARAGSLAAVALMGSVALIDRPSALGFEAITGLAVVAALDRILGKGSDWVAGFWAALAVMAGGWPALVVIILPTIVMGRRGSYVSFPLMGPPLAAFVGWSVWALMVAPGVVWGEALAGPLKSPVAWGFALMVVGMGLPWSPFATLAARRSVRGGWSEEGRQYVHGWLQVAGASALAGTFLPGLDTAAWLPTLAGLAIAAASGMDRALRPGASRGARWTLLGLALVVALGWAAVVVPYGTYLAAAVPYYRLPAIVLVAGAIVVGAFAIVGTWERRTRWAVGIVLAVALGVKLAHAAVYAPEWNYRVGQGPWGRAIGQWVPPRWNIYVFHPWPSDLAFATEHPLRQLVSPTLLKYEVADDGRPVFVLLNASEFEHWPSAAPKLLKVREFEDSRGRAVVLARTEGELFIRREGD